MTTSTMVVTAGAARMERPDAAIVAVAFSGVSIAVARDAATPCDAILLGDAMSKMRTREAAITDTRTADGSTRAATATADAIAARWRSPIAAGLSPAASI